MNKEYDRRKFLKDSLALSALAAVPLGIRAEPGFRQAGSVESAPLKILILGGTGFLGPQQIAYALEKGHSVSTFTRGRTQPTTQQDVFNRVEQLLGDRENDLESLKGRDWDLVIDNSGNRINWVKDTVALLKDHAGMYLYTSSTGVYYPYLGKDIREDTRPVLKVPEGITQTQKYEYDYGVMKALNEMEVQKGFGKDRTLIVRPTYMVGPGDRTDRFTYWPLRLAEGGEVLVPGKAQDPVQFIDVRDVAGFMIRLAEQKAAGVYNAVGPASAMGMHAFIYGAHAAFSSPVSYVMADDYTFLQQHQILDQIPWILPLGDNAGSAMINNERAIHQGLRFTPLADSVRDIYAWWQSEAITAERKQKMAETPLWKNEREIIRAWKSRKS